MDVENADFAGAKICHLDKNLLSTTVLAYKEIKKI
jgi:hypothetical protein